MALIEYTIEVTGDNSVVSPAVGVTLHEGDKVTFKSNNAENVIRYPRTSPFSDLPEKENLPVGRTRKGPFTIMNKPTPGKYHFDCGHIVGGKFKKWGGGGGNTPVNP